MTTKAGTIARAWRILLADDHPLARRGWKALLESQARLIVCAEAATGAEAVEHAIRIRPELAILDVNMPRMGGLEATRAIRSASPNTSVIVIASDSGEATAQAARLAGAQAYVLKSAPESDLLAAVSSVRAHRSFFTGGVDASSLNVRVGAQLNRPLPLTSREQQVLAMVARGKRNKEIAFDLGISVRTVETHRQRVMNKMHFASLSELVRFAIRSCLLGP